MTKNQMTTLFAGALGALAMGMIACGAATPTKELADARRAYEEARSGQAQQLVPAQVLSAKQALDRAERAFEDDPGSFQEKSLAYIAQRKAELAMAQAGQADAQRDAQAAEAEYKQVQDELRKQAEKEAAKTKKALDENQRALEKVRSELSEQDNKLSAAAKALKQQEEELRQRQAELEARQKELEKEKGARAEAEKARKEAEAKYAAAMKSLEEIAKVQEEKRGLVITLDGAVLFTTGKSELLPIAKQKLSRVAEVLQEQDPSKTIVVEGHTDSVGTEANNMKLSQARADSVRNHLVSEGVEAHRIKAVGKGESEPIADNKTPDGRANNRRVEIIVK